MGDPPPPPPPPQLPRPSDNKSLAAAAPAEVARDNALARESKLLLLPAATGTLFHKRKSKRADNLDSSSCNEAEMTKKKKKKKHNNHTNRRTPCPGGGEEVVIDGHLAVNGENDQEDKDAQNSATNNISGDPEDSSPPLRTAADRRHTIRKRIKFIMGGDDDEDEGGLHVGEEEIHKKEAATAEAVDQRNCQLPRANSDESATALQTNSSTLRLRTPCSTEKVLEQEKRKLKGSDEKRAKGGRNKTTAKTTRNASTSNRTRFRFFRLNKRTIRAVVLLLVKLCGLLVASILIPSSKLVTAVGSGVAQSEPPQGSATNMDDLLDEYGDLISVDGYASSTIIAVSPTNGNSSSLNANFFASNILCIGKWSVELL